jgi:hypothetical protein
LRKDLLKQLDEEYHPVFTTRTGALKNKGLSTIEQGTALVSPIEYFSYMSRTDPWNREHVWVVFKTGAVSDIHPFS